MPRDIRVVDSITQPDDSEGAVVVAGSHGGISSGRYAAQLGLRGIIFNDAGVGKNEAGIQSLPYLDDLGLPTATVDNESARIGDGLSMVEGGVVSHVNDAAADCGCEVGQSAVECAAAMSDAERDPVREDVGNEMTQEKVRDGDTPVWTLDSIGLINDEHEGAITVTGSHGERLAGEIDSYIQADVAGITLFDAGVGKDDAGIGRIETMDERGIPAATVDVESAQIGDSTSALEDGILSHVNDIAADLGISPGDSCSDFVERVREKK
ncbi:hypothetical protein NDI54_19655 [Haloarcula sp. S1AR25-5A]|uniref:Uncharacterized protein n=1 Tax=Haloarcula terrestris TaxID=2950533 RepID=A0AAE4F3D6_9EURY|nr:hypothetical protein [Haloarcula terrestris]MDS0223561.1 hypothetical protein [Haloarcula terrestris]